VRFSFPSLFFLVACFHFHLFFFCLLYRALHTLLSWEPAPTQQAPHSPWFVPLVQQIVTFCFWFSTCQVEHQLALDSHSSAPQGMMLVERFVLTATVICMLGQWATPPITVPRFLVCKGLCLLLASILFETQSKRQCFVL
jgi:hypothetical protein